MVPIFEQFIFHNDLSVNLLGFNLSLWLMINKKLKIETYLLSLWN